jgi:superfamily II DNA or RNA helicase
VREEVGISPAAMNGLTSANGQAEADVHFFVNPKASLGTGGLVLDVFGRGPNVGGSPGKLKRIGVSPEELEELLLPPTAGDETGSGKEGPSVSRLTLISEISSSPVATQAQGGRGRKRTGYGVRRLRLPPQLFESVLPYQCAKGTLGWWDGRVQKNLHPLWWDSGSAWHLTLRLDIDQAGVAWLRGALEREGESVPLKDPVLILPPVSNSHAGDSSHTSLVVFDESIGRLEIDRRRDLPWITLLRRTSEVTIPKGDVEEALTELLELPALPRFEIPGELELIEEGSPVEPRLLLEEAPGFGSLSAPLVAEVSFDYGGLRVSAEDARSAVVDWEERTLLRRDLEREHAALMRLLELGLRPVGLSDEGKVQALELSPNELPGVVEPLLREGWVVRVEGRSVRSPSPPSLRVESGIDWFDLSGEVEFAGDRMELTKVLEAVSRGNRFIELEDGSQGLLPESWMETYDSLAKLARSETEDGLRFLPSQALIVDALLTAMPPADVDSAFARLRERLSSFERIKPKKELPSFDGELRSYQRRGLGWLNFLREFGLGGVLADDMGLGKTVQVLALVQMHRTASKSTRLPFLVVAPRSIVYNWLDEAARFTPKLKVAEYRGRDRERLRDRFSEYDIIVTTYGTMRRDISQLAAVEFDTVILDEAQAIKNAASQTAKASRLLAARHRLALTGTPIENHLGELGSIFEFLNPGLLGRLPRLEVLVGSRTPSKEELTRIAEDMRPFILRRTKTEVLPDLPPKTEQVLLVRMREAQREIYDRVRAAYQASLLEQVEAKGVGGSAIQVLEALLRLRQVACHPGLVDKSWEGAGSAKLEALFEQVSEVLDEGHKLLVFSQFTSLLAYVRRDLDQRDVPYAYLDGQTRDRAKVVERFQNDPSCNLFLISLKAGGVGLNLTAAGYVFLLDPWWNPAVEAQAIDRTHRIGQTQPVFAYKMIARDTVEEKILQLQSSKRKLADAILDGEGQSLRDLTADDLRMLLS